MLVSGICQKILVWKIPLTSMVYFYNIKYQLCYLKRCLYTQKRNSICSLLQVFFIITCSFSVFVENCILLPKDINEFVTHKLCSCVLYMYGFDFLPFYPYFLLLVIKGQFFPRTKILFQSAFFSALKSFYKSQIHPFPLMLMPRHEM